MRCEAVWNSGKLRGEHGDSGRVCAEVRMDMLYVIASTPIRKYSGFCNIYEMTKNSSVGVPSHHERLPGDRDDGKWLSRQRYDAAEQFA